MDPFEELERMAQNATASKSTEPTEGEISRWRRLFNYSRLEAIALINAHRSDVTRIQIPDEHWALIKEEREAAGYDRETYEHSLQLKDVLNSQSTVVHDAEGKAWCLIRLGGLLDSAEKVKEVAGLEEVPDVTEGQNDMGIANFCMVDEEAKKKIEQWVEQQRAL
jgi:hypothetical protein